MAQGAIMLDGERVVMAADTAVTGPASPEGVPPVRGHTARICMLPHMGAALLSVGEIALAAQMHTSLLMSGSDDIDQAVRAVWPHLDNDLHHAIARPKPPNGVRGFEAILAGWSQERGAMVGYAYTPDEDEFAHLVHIYGEEDFPELGFERTSTTLYRPVGCTKCGNTGYRGRTGVHELLVGTGEMQKLVAKSPTIADIRDLAYSEGMRTLLQDGVMKIFKGQTDLNQLRKVAAE